MRLVCHSPPVGLGCAKPNRVDQAGGEACIGKDALQGQIARLGLWCAACCRRFVFSPPAFAQFGNENPFNSTGLVALEILALTDGFAEFCGRVDSFGQVASKRMSRLASAK